MNTITQELVQAALEAEKAGVEAPPAPPTTPPPPPAPPAPIVTLDAEKFAAAFAAQIGDKLAEILTEATKARATTPPQETALPPEFRPQQSVYIAAKTLALPGKEAVEIFDKINSEEIEYEVAKTNFTTKNPREIDKFTAQYGDSLTEGFEDLLRKECGFFRGKAAATTMANIPASFADFMSSKMRMTPRMGKIWAQFLSPHYEFGMGKGTYINVPRVGLLPSPTDTIAWDLDGIDFSTTSQNLENGYEKVEVRRRGMGGLGRNNDPIAVDEFLTYHSILPLMKHIQEVIGNNYANYEDIATYRQYLTGNITRFYAESTKSVQPLATSLSPSDGALTVKSLDYFFAHAIGDLGIIPYADGTLNLVIHPNVLPAFWAELRALSAPPDKERIANVTNMMRAQNPNIRETISGFRGTHGGFNIFTHEGMPVIPNYMQVTENSRNWYEGIAFGPGAVGQAISMPQQIRYDEVAKFGTLLRLIWISYQNIQAMERGGATTGAGIGPLSQIMKIRVSR